MMFLISGLESATPLMIWEILFQFDVLAKFFFSALHFDLNPLKGKSFPRTLIMYVSSGLRFSILVDLPVDDSPTTPNNLAMLKLF